MDDAAFDAALRHHIKTQTWAPSPGHIWAAWDELQSAAVYTQRHCSRQHTQPAPPKATLSAERLAYHRKNVAAACRAGAQAQAADRAERLRRYGSPEQRAPEYRSAGWAPHEQRGA